MKKNIGGYDGFLRMLIAMILVFSAVFFGKFWLLLIAAPIILTNYMMYCPLYKVFGWDFSEGKPNTTAH